jgi:pilus assembly protein CpaF
MVLMAGMDLPVRAIREQVTSAVHMICQIARFSDGSRRVSRITEVTGMERDMVTMQDIFEYRQTGVDDNGRVEGRLRPTGVVPSFVEEIGVRGIALNRNIFNPEKEH